jgi:hypothetical protein
MLRRSLLWGLTVVLIAALASLIMRGRRLEKEAQKPVDIVRKLKPSATSVLAPEELEILGSSMKLKGNTAHNQIEIRNSGKLPYKEIQLRIDYFDNSGKMIAVRNHSIAGTVMPGSTLKATDIPIENIPGSATRFRISILRADIG